MQISPTYDIPYLFDQPQYTLEALLSPIRQRLEQAPPSGNPYEVSVRNSLTILIIDTYGERAQYIANLLVTAGYRPLVTANALAAFTLFLQGACLPLAIVLGHEDGSSRLFLLRLQQQLAQKYGWRAPLLRLHAPVHATLPPDFLSPKTSAANLSLLPHAQAPSELADQATPPMRTESLTELSEPAPTFPSPLLAPGGLAHNGYEPVSESFDASLLRIPQLDFTDPLPMPHQQSPASAPVPDRALALPHLELATQIPELSTPQALPSTPMDLVPQELIAQHTQDGEELLANIEAYREARTSLEGQTLIIRYQMRKQLGAGAYSDVYLAYDRFREQECAIKAMQIDLLPAPLASNALEEVTLFQQEATLVNSLKHPHILPIWNSGKSYVSSAPFIYKSIPYCAEGSLQSWIQRRVEQGLYSLKEVLPVVQQLADALQYMHSARVLYQNFKQANILVIKSGKHVQKLEVALSDLSVPQHAPLALLSPEGLLYIAPERWEGTVLPASDQYGLAAVVYELLTGRPPYQGISAHILKILHTTKRPQAVHILNRKLSPGVNNVLMRALARRPQDRFESIAHFFGALERSS